MSGFRIDLDIVWNAQLLLKRTHVVGQDAGVALAEVAGNRDVDLVRVREIHLGRGARRT